MYTEFAYAGPDSNSDSENEYTTIHEDSILVDEDCEDSILVDEDCEKELERMPATTSYMVRTESQMTDEIEINARTEEQVLIEINNVELLKQTIKNTSEAQFNTEFECEFLGSIDTLVTPGKLRQLTYRAPKTSNAGLDVHQHPEEGHTYFLTADVARGTQNDYSAFVVVDVTEIPYKVVAKFRDNEIKPLIFPSKIYDVARAYNQAFVLIEVNDIGEQVASAMQFDLEYDNLIMASMRGRAGQVIGAGFSGGRAQLGVRTTKAVKKIGCSNLKQLVEDNKLILEDYDCINELSTFIVKGSSFEADDGCNDDLVACLFIFAWLTDQTYFKELTNNDIRRVMMNEQQDMLEQDMAPFGFIVNGLEDENIGEMVDEYGTRWSPIVRDSSRSW
jgi:hypothetical protein